MNLNRLEEQLNNAIANGDITEQQARDEYFTALAEIEEDEIREAGERQREIDNEQEEP